LLLEGQYSLNIAFSYRHIRIVEQINFFVNTFLGSLHMRQMGLLPNLNSQAAFLCEARFLQYSAST